MGRRGRQIGKYCSLSSGGQKNESTALQNTNLEVGASCKHFNYFNYTPANKQKQNSKTNAIILFLIIKEIAQPISSHRIE